MIDHAQTPLVEITVPVNGVPDLLTYSAPELFSGSSLVGKRVEVSVGHRRVVGVVVNDQNVTCPPGVVARAIERVIDDTPVVTPQQFALCRFVAEYYFAPLGETLRLCLPAGTPKNLPKDAKPKKARANRKVVSPSTQQLGQTIVLNPEQHFAVDQIVEAPEDQKAFLLQGVTGSGKTEVYIEVAKAALAKGQSVLVVVPEIVLTPQLLMRFEKQLQTPIMMLHSGLTPAHRRETLLKLLRGEARVAIGARSALFAPMPNLGLIVVDEEHDTSLKQDETPRYHGRDVAMWRARNENATIILGSATPSLESRLNVERQKLTLVKLTQRVGASGVLPPVEVVDLKSRSQHQPHRKKDRAKSDGQTLCILSGPLKDAMSAALAQGEQVMLFLNRRGYAAFSLCDACGEIVQCKSCSVSMTYHHKSNLLRCHQCDLTMGLPNFCPACNEGPMLCLGLGTERVEQEVAMCFPEARIARLDRDVANSTKKIDTILSDMNAGETDVLIGTQMIAKGHDFGRVSLVGVIMADTALAMPDFRASERAFQLLTQVAGRAGRRDQASKVIIQTFNPNHPAIAFAKTHDVEGFAKYETDIRKSMKQAPFVRSALLRLESASPADAELAAQYVQQCLLASIQNMGLAKDCHVLGPAPAPLERLRGKSRWHLYLRTSTTQARAELIGTVKNLAAIKQVLKQTRSKLIIDIDPIQML